MKLVDFKCNELVGQQVLAFTLFRDGKRLKFIRKITKANRHHFRIEKSKMLFDYCGRQMLKSDSVQQFQVTHCLLLTAEEAIQLKQQWSLKSSSKREQKIKELQSEINKLKSLQS